MTLPRRLAAEALGTALLLMAVVGSGIMAERLAAGSPAIALGINVMATGAGLLAAILAFGAVSGAHFNPAVSCCMALSGQLRWRELPGYVLAQVLGAVMGVVIVNLMFTATMVSVAHHPRHGPDQLLGEFVATFGLLSIIIGCSRNRPAITPFAIAAYVVAACWFTASIAFANPAVTFARTLSDTFTGIRPVDAPAFVAAQLAGAMAATAIMSWLLKK